MRLGLHVSIAGKIYESVERARALGCETMQIFSRNPRGWAAAKLITEDVVELKRLRREAGITPLVIHIPYLINLASPEEGLWRKSVQAYIEDIERADALGAEYFVTHLGSHRGRGEEYGIKRFSDGLNTAIEKTRPKTMILLETTSGSGDSLGYKFEHIKEIIANVKSKKSVGVCLDTCHVYTAGYDIAAKDGLEETLTEFDSLIGIEKLRVVHLNDSKGALGSRLDRHEHIGKGRIGLNGFKIFLNHPKLRALPYILETPKDNPKWDKMNLKTVRDLCKG